MLEMRDVIAHEIIKRCPFIARNWLPRKFVEIVLCPFAKTLVIRRSLHDACDVQVEISPKHDEFTPRRVAILLQRNPGILLVTIKDQIFLKLCANEPLMVIGSRIDQMPDHLAWTPFPRLRTSARFLVAHPLQKGRGPIDCFAQLRNVLLQRH